MLWQKKKVNNDQFDSLRKQGVAAIFCSLLSNRHFDHISSKEDMKKLFDSSINDLENPENIANMREACKFLINAKGKDVVIYGDYDADGIISSYICDSLLMQLGAKSVDVYLPSRIDDGYGLNEDSVKNLLSICKKPYGLVVVLDCGSSSNNQITKIRQQLTQADVIVIDHHIIDEKNFSASANYVVNPRINNATAYCTGALMFQVARECATLSDDPIYYLDYLPYAAITTISDVCPLVGSNRVIVKNGLKRLSLCTDVGLTELFKIAEIDMKNCHVEDISFRIAPMINASGRIKVASKAFQLLKKKTIEEAYEMALLLKNLNEERKTIQTQIAKEALERFENERQGRNSALLYSENWPPSIVGIVCSKIVDKYKIPAICFGKTKEFIKGSARSTNGINIKKIMDSCSEIFVKYGGHEMAAGAELRNDRIHDAWDVFDKAVEQYKSSHVLGEPVLYYDFEMDDSLLLRLDDVFCDRLSLLEPFGSENENPIFLARRVNCKKAKVWSKNNGAFVSMSNLNLNCVAYGDNLNTIEGQTVDMLFSIVRSFVRGEKWHLKIVDWKRV